MLIVFIAFVAMFDAILGGIKPTMLSLLDCAQKLIQNGIGLQPLTWWPDASTFAWWPDDLSLQSVRLAVLACRVSWALSRSMPKGRHAASSSWRSTNITPTCR